MGDPCNVYPPGSCEFPLVVALDTPVVGDLSTSSDDLQDCATCWCDQGPEDILRFEIPSGAATYDVTFDLTGSDDAIQVSLLYDSPCHGQGPMGQGPFDCFDAMQGPGGMWQRNLSPGTYYLVMESWDPLGMGNYALTISATPQ